MRITTLISAILFPLALRVGIYTALATAHLAHATHLLPIHQAQPIGEQVGFFGNATVTVTELSYASMRAIFLLEEHFWPNGQPIVLILPPRNSVSFNLLVTHFLGMTTVAYTEFVDEKLREKLYPIMYAETEAQTIVRVASVPNAIGFSSYIGPQHERFGIFLFRLSQD